MATRKAANEEHRQFTVMSASKEISCMKSGKTDGQPELLFTHGAGGTLSSPAMVNFTAGFSKISSITSFQGNMNLKSRTGMFEAVINHSKKGKKAHLAPALGGRSMGARAAVLAMSDDIMNLVLVSYPLHTDKEVRDQILLDLPEEKNVLFVSGDHDSMCDLDHLNKVRKGMRCVTWLAKVRDADHGMNVKPKKATTQIGEETGRLAAEWLCERNKEETECEISWEVDHEREGTVKRTKWRAGELKSDQTDVRAVTSKSQARQGKSKREQKSEIQNQDKDKSSGGITKKEGVDLDEELRHSKRRKKA